ncbi:hypothetical protein AAC387_Pa07g3121 [Persea americana]
MQSQNLEPPEAPANLNPPKPISKNPITSIQNHFSSFLQQISGFLPPKPPSLPSFPQNPTSLKTHFDNTIQTIGNHAKQALQMGFPQPLSTNARTPNFARAYPLQRVPPEARPMPVEAIEERLAGIPVYALSNSAEEFVLLSGVRTGKSLGLFCFKKEDAEALLEQMKAMDPGMQRGSKVVAVALNKVFQLKVDGVAFRFIPDSSQIANALKEREKVGDLANGFSGVPVFQSRSLILMSQKKRYRPVFFRKEDLDRSLQRASKQRKQLNPALRKGDVQVCVLEEIIKGMKESSSSNWDDVVFIPPGFDVSTNVSQ